MVDFDINNSLEELEGIPFEVTDFQSSLTLKCQGLRSKKLKDFTIEELRVMIGQSISLNYLIPLALETLAQNPFIGGDFYKGDLLEQILRIDKDFWNQNETLLYELTEIIISVKSTIESLSPLIKDYELP